VQPMHHFGGAARPSASAAQSLWILGPTRRARRLHEIPARRTCCVICPEGAKTLRVIRSARSLTEWTSLAFLRRGANRPMPTNGRGRALRREVEGSRLERPHPDRPDASRPRVKEPNRKQGEIRFEIPEDTLPPMHPARMLWNVVGTLDLGEFLKNAKAVFRWIVGDLTVGHHTLSGFRAGLLQVLRLSTFWNMCGGAGSPNPPDHVWEMWQARATPFRVAEPDDREHALEVID